MSAAPPANAPPASGRPAKKSETLEIRLDHQTKAVFMARCQAQGMTASEAVRSFISGPVSPWASPPVSPLARRRQGPGWTLVAALGAGLALGAIAAPSLAQSASRAVHADDDRAAFDRLDTDRDGRVSFSEFQAR